MVVVVSAMVSVVVVGDGGCVGENGVVVILVGGGSCVVEGIIVAVVMGALEEGVGQQRQITQFGPQCTHRLVGKEA